MWISYYLLSYIQKWSNNPYFRGNFFTKNNKKYVNIFENQDSSLMKNLSLANCLVKIPAKKIALKSDFLEIYELNNGL